MLATESFSPFGCQLAAAQASRSSIARRRSDSEPMAEVWIIVADSHGPCLATMARIMSTRAARRRGRRPLARALAMAAAAFALPLAVATPEASLPASAFTVPPGFEIKLVAGSAAGESADRGRLRRAGPAVRDRLVRLQRQGREAARGEAAPDRAARGHGRRRRVRHEHRVRRSHDVPGRRDVVRRIALRRRAAEHLEAHRHRRRRRRRSGARSGSTARR